MTTAPSDTAIRVRSLEETDLQDIVRIMEQTRNEYQPDLWEDRLVYYLRRDPETSVVAEADGKVVGFMLGDVRAGEFGIDEASAWVEVLGVDPAAVGRGVGRALGEEMVRRFRERGVPVVRTMVDESMPDVAGFFASLGFAEDSLRPFVRKLTD